MKLFTAIAGLATAFGLCATPANASVILYGTRVVYPGDARDVTVQANNNGTVPVLVQTWLDNGDPNATPEDSNVPFVLTPPLYRLEPNATQSVRIVYTHDPLPADRESLYWLSVLEIPPTPVASEAKPNELRVLFRTRVKLFFRPAGLDGTARDAPKSVAWSLEKDASGATVLVARNPTPFYVSYAKIAVGSGDAKVEIAGGGMVSPHDSARFAVGENAASTRSATEVTYSFIDDFGVNVDAHAPLNGN